MYLFAHYLKYKLAICRTLYLASRINWDNLQTSFVICLTNMTKKLSTTITDIDRLATNNSVSFFAISNISLIVTASIYKPVGYCDTLQKPLI